MNKEEYRVIFKEVDETIGNIFTEFQDVITVLKNDGRFVRTRLLLAFSFAEVICGIFDKFYNLNLGNEDLMKKWFKEYCLTDKNQVYREHQDIKKLDENYFYKLRCSVVHAFALPEQEDKNAILFVNGNESHQNLDKFRKGFTEKGFKPMIISPDSITAFFIDGASNFCKEVFVNENIATVDNFNSLKRVRDEFYRRGAKHIKLSSI